MSSSAPSSPNTVSFPTPVPAQTLNNMQKVILESLVNAASTIHSSTAIIAFAESLYGKDNVAQAQNIRRNDEKMQGQNGWHGETPGHRALARAYALLVEDGSDSAAAELNTIALGRLVRADWEGQVDAVRRGY